MKRSLNECSLNEMKRSLNECSLNEMNVPKNEIKRSLNKCPLNEMKLTLNSVSCHEGLEVLTSVSKVYMFRFVRHQLMYKYYTRWCANL